MAQRTFNFDEQWKALKTGLELIIKICQNVVTDQQITFKQWQDLYHIVYSWCTRPEEKKKEELYQKVSTLFEETAKVEEKFLREKRGDFLLKDYLTRFNNYTSATFKTKNIFAYMHRYWIPSQNSNGDNNVRDIDEVLYSTPLKDQSNAL
jgi:hypothetical protein